MSWLEVPFLLGVVGALFLSIKKIDERIDGISERLARIEGQLISIPKRKTDKEVPLGECRELPKQTRVGGIDFDI